MSGYYQVLISRLRQCYWPVFMDQLISSSDIEKVIPIDYLDENERVLIPNYDQRRVRAFFDDLKAGKKLAPIDIENESSQYRITSPIRWGGPVVVDGRHRFAAAVLAKEKYIAATFGGLETTINWLTGKRKRIPEEMTA